MLPFAYALRNLWRRRGRTVVTLLGVAVITTLVVLMGGFASALGSKARETASPDVIVITGSASEHDLVRSVIARTAAEIVAAKLPGVVERGGLRAASPEIHIATRKGNRIGMMRGVQPAAFLVHEKVAVVEGREPTGFRELLAGRLAETRMDLPEGALDVGKTIELEGVMWTVVGRFAAPGTVLEAEIWGRLDDIVEATARTDLSCVMARLESAAAVDDARLWIFRNATAFEVSAITQTELFKSLQNALDPIAGLAWLMALLVFIGGVFACANTMFAAVLARTREMGALRALGYGPFAIGWSLLTESLLLGVVGGLIGFWAAGLFGEVPLKFPMGAFYLDLSPSVRVGGLAAALAVGFLGGLVPAVRALRMPLTDALGGKL
ncbi:MAG: ABC transporter permease [Planctomycetota bacterium]|nr:ABC transporter permease [Planctomycetota bacterium]